MYLWRDWVSGNDDQRPPSFTNLGHNAAGEAAQAPQVFTHAGPVYRWNRVPHHIDTAGAAVAAAAPASVSPIPQSYCQPIPPVARRGPPYAVLLTGEVT